MRTDRDTGPGDAATAAESTPETFRGVTSNGPDNATAGLAPLDYAARHAAARR